MTFDPIPKADLEPLESLFADGSDMLHQVLSRLHWAEQAADWAALQIAALYAALPDVIDETWTYAGTDASVDPGPGKVAIRVESDESRTWALSAAGVDSLKQGSTIVLTDDPASPPVTAFRQYTVTSDPVDHGDWLSFHSVRIATFGTLTTPTVGATVRLILR